MYAIGNFFFRLLELSYFPLNFCRPAVLLSPNFSSACIIITCSHTLGHLNWAFPLSLCKNWIISEKKEKHQEMWFVVISFVPPIYLYSFPQVSLSATGLYWFSTTVFRLFRSGVTLWKFSLYSCKRK